MEPQELRALIIVLVVGTLVAVVAGTALFFIFRAFGQREAGGDKHMGLIAALILFVFLCCAALLVLAYRG